MQIFAYFPRRFALFAIVPSLYLFDAVPDMNGDSLRWRARKARHLLSGRERFAGGTSMSDLTRSGAPSTLGGFAAARVVHILRLLRLDASAHPLVDFLAEQLRRAEGRAERAEAALREALARAATAEAEVRQLRERAE